MHTCGCFLKKILGDKKASYSPLIVVNLCYMVEIPRGTNIESTNILDYILLYNVTKLYIPTE